MGDVSALSVALTRKDVPWYAKALIAVVVAYALSPVDLIPDFIPVLGLLDDLLLLPLGIVLSVKLIPDDVWIECQKIAKDNGGSTKPNWIAGGFIILLWVVLIVVIVRAICCK